MSFELSDLYELKFEYHPEYLFASVVSNQDGLDMSKDFWLRILNEGKKSGHKKILIEENIEGNLTASEIYDFSVWLSKQKADNMLVAFTDVHTEHLESNQFGELIATNRGFRVRVFATKDEAVKWLESF